MRMIVTNILNVMHLGYWNDDNLSIFTGYYCPEASDHPTPCPAGKYGPKPLMASLTDCSPCMAGYYCPQTGLNTSYAKCNAGFYCKAGSTSAQPINETFGNECPSGTFCQVGSSSPTLCKAGLPKTIPKLDLFIN